MEKLLTKILPGTLLIGVLLASGIVWSGEHEKRGGFDPDRMLSHMTERLELSASQQADIEKVLASGKEAAEVDRKRMGEIRDALRAQRADFNESEAQKLSQELGQITARISYQMVSSHAEIYQLLNEDQREKMDTMMATRDQRRDKSGHKRDK